MKIEAVFPDFIAFMQEKGAAVRTVEERKRFLYGSIKKAIGDIHIHELQLADLSRVEFLAQDQGETGPWGAIITLRRYLRYLTHRGYKLNFYWRDIEIPKMVHKEVEALTREEIEQVRKGIESMVVIHLRGREYIRHRPRDKNAQLRMRTLFEVILHTGMRVSEALSVNIQDINFFTEEVVITNGKTGERDTISLAGAMPYIKKYLASRTDSCAALFVSDQGRLAYVSAKSYLRKLRKRIGLQKHFTHRLIRKTYVTLLLEGGMDIKAVQYQARHKSERTTLRHYVAVNKVRARVASNMIMQNV